MYLCYFDTNNTRTKQKEKYKCINIKKGDGGQDMCLTHLQTDNNNQKSCYILYWLVSCYTFVYSPQDELKYVHLCVCVSERERERKNDRMYFLGKVFQNTETFSTLISLN